MNQQFVWHRNDIANLGQTLIDMAPSYEFAAGVAALCTAVGAKVTLPALPPIVEVRSVQSPQSVQLPPPS